MDGGSIHKITPQHPKFPWHIPKHNALPASTCIVSFTRDSRPGIFLIVSPFGVPNKSTRHVSISTGAACSPSQLPALFGFVSLATASRAPWRRHGR